MCVECMCHGLALLGFSQCEVVQWMVSHWVSWLPVIGLTMADHLWPAFLFRHWEHGLATGQAIFLQKV